MNELRQRANQPDSLNNQSSSSTSTTTGTSSSYESQLLSARNTLKERVKEQQSKDGIYEDDPEEEGREGEDDDDDQVVVEPREGEGTNRRGSGNGMKGEEEVDEELVREMLIGESERSSSSHSSNQASGSNSKTTPLFPQNQFPPGHFYRDPTPPIVEEVPLPPPPPQRPMGEEATCRICFDGEEDQDSGRLFSPCLCAGTSRFVHVNCLQRWRVRSAGATAFYKCDLCQYEYRISRSKISGLATNRIALGIVTFFFFAFLIFLAGFITTGIVEGVQSRQARSMFDDFWVSDYQIITETVAEAVDFLSLDRFSFPSSSSSSSWSLPLPSLLYHSDGTSTLLKRTIQHFIKGFSFVGIASFFQTIFASSAFGIFGLRGSLFRAVRPSGNGRRNGDNNVSMSQLVIVALVLVGTYRTILRVYSFVEWGSKKALKRVEDAVMDVGTRGV